MATNTPNLNLRKPSSADPVNVLTDLDANFDKIDTALAPGTFRVADPVIVVTYNADATIASVVEAGITTTFTYNADGTIATQTRLGVTRTYSYTAGQLVGVA